QLNASAILSPLDVTAVEAATPKGMNSGGFTALTSNAVTASSGQTLLILVAAESESSGQTRSITSVGGTAVQGRSGRQFTTNGANPPPTWNTISGFTLIDTAFQSEGTAPRVHRSANYIGPSASSVTGSISGNAAWGTIALELLSATTPSPTPTPTASPTPTAT